MSMLSRIISANLKRQNSKRCGTQSTYVFVAHRTSRYNLLLMPGKSGCACLIFA